jgi:predicted nucleic acid-binding protein
MSATKVFFDSDVLLYLLSSDTAKANTAEDLLSQGGIVSVQVLNEIANVARRKLGKSWIEVREILDTLKAVCTVEPISVATHERAVFLAERFGYSNYDALILAAALLSGCSVVYSEDMQHGQIIERELTIRNPFSL